MRYVEIVNETKPRSTTKVWHVTEARRIPQIMKQGLKPRIGKSSSRAKEKVPAIYVFPDVISLIDGVTNWLGDETPFRQAVLELTVPTDWIVEDDLRWECRILQPVPPQMIRIAVPDLDEWDGKSL